MNPSDWEFGVAHLVVGVLLLVPLAVTVQASTDASVIGTLAGSPIGVVAQVSDTFEFWFDEKGNGRYRFLFPESVGPIINSPGQIVDGNLTYFLPTTVTNGDVRVWEDPPMTVLSDLLRFTDAAGI